MRKSSGPRKIVCERVDTTKISECWIDCLIHFRTAKNHHVKTDGGECDSLRDQENLQSNMTFVIMFQNI